MMRVGITGATGLLGFHTRAYATRTGAFEPVIGGRTIFTDESEMDRFLLGSDCVMHLAGVAHGDEHVVAATNVELARKLIAGLDRMKRPVPVLYASTLQVEKDTAYGRSKREAGEILLSWGARAGVPVSVAIIPNVFGEFAKPNHNSVVATFCEQLIAGREPRVDYEASIRLMHAQDVAKILAHSLQQMGHGTLRLEEGTEITVGDLYEALKGYKATYDRNEVPDLSDPFRRRLFNVFRSHLQNTWYPRDLVSRTDVRGSLFELVRHGGAGQTFISTTKPGQVRGNHWHARKFERFCVVSGEAEMRIRKLFADEVTTYRLSGERPSFVDTQTFVVHNLVNTGTGDLVTAFWASELFNESDPDTYAESVSL